MDAKSRYAGEYPDEHEADQYRAEAEAQLEDIVACGNCFAGGDGRFGSNEFAPEGDSGIQNQFLIHPVIQIAANQSPGHDGDGGGHDGYTAGEGSGKCYGFGIDCGVARHGSIYHDFLCGDKGVARDEG